MQRVLLSAARAAEKANVVCFHIFLTWIHLVTVTVFFCWITHNDLWCDVFLFTLWFEPQIDFPQHRCDKQACYCSLLLPPTSIHNCNGYTCTVFALGNSVSTTAVRQGVWAPGSGGWRVSDDFSRSSYTPLPNVSTGRQSDCSLSVHTMLWVSAPSQQSGWRTVWEEVCSALHYSN